MSDYSVLQNLTERPPQVIMHFAKALPLAVQQSHLKKAKIKTKHMHMPKERISCTDSQISYGNPAVLSRFPYKPCTLLKGKKVDPSTYPT